MNWKKISLLMGVAVGCAGVVMAQNYYDDDIYFDASKAQKNVKTVKVVKKVSTDKTTTSYDYPSADTYTVVTSNSRDVDEYNRRGSYVSADTVSTSSDEDNFAYTKRIERFYNPDIVSKSGDEDLIYYYTSADDDLQDATTVNVYVSTPGIWGSWYPGAWSWAWASPWYSSWSLYSPWYSFSWGWDPYWSFGWGPSLSWGFGWGWNLGWVGSAWHHHGHGFNHWGPAPARPIGGAYRPSHHSGYAGVGGGRHSNNRYGMASHSRYDNRGSNGGSRPGANIRYGNTSGRQSIGSNQRGSSARPNTQQRPSSGVSGGGQRPGANIVHNTQTSNYNPSNATRPNGTYSSSNRPSNSGGYRQGANSSNRSNSSFGSSRQSSSNTSRSSNSYNSSSSSRSSSGGWSGGSNGGGSHSGGGSYSGGGSRGGRH